MSCDAELGDESPYDLIYYAEAVDYCVWWSNRTLGFDRLTAVEHDDVFELIGYNYDDSDDSLMIMDSLYITANLAHTLAKHGYVWLWLRD